PVVVARDFNAHSTEWGCRPRQGDPQMGNAVIGWAAGLGLLLMNRGSAGTCVRPKRESVMDLTWASPSAARIFREWAVVTGSETLSDHRYIVWALSPRTPLQVPGCRPRVGSRDLPLPRWALSQLDSDMFRAAVLTATWHLDEVPGEWDTSPQEGARRLVGIVKSACDIAMLRSHPRRRRAAYWWTAAIAELREDAVHARRVYTWARREDEDAEKEKRGYQRARIALKAAITEAKKGAWEQLESSLDEDPWARPYKRTVGKIHPRAPPPTESLSPQVLEGLLDTLFPRVEGCPPRLPTPEDGEWAEDLGVSPEELNRARKRLGGRDKAPGSDGLPGSRPWRSEHVRSYQGDIKRVSQGWGLPPEWRRAKLVLLPKANKTPDGPLAFRLICLLDEAGKMLERVIADLLVRHQSSNG
ncbi:Retrovirus-related Pol polyprotein from type-1 retrotransposable element R1, partial [Harpegnathos saltator]